MEHFHFPSLPVDSICIDDTLARCKVCSFYFSIAHGGKNDVTTHIIGKQQIRDASAVSSSRSVTSVFQSQTSDGQIGAEARWSVFIAKHNLAFLTSDHDTTPFPKNFPDTTIAKMVACGRTKTTTIAKEALATHYLSKVAASMMNPFSIMIDM